VLALIAVINLGFCIKLHNTLVFVFVAPESGTGRTIEDIVEHNIYLHKNPLLLTGVILFLMAVLMSIAFVSRQQWKSRQVAKKLTLLSTPAHEALLARIDQSDNTLRQTGHQNIVATSTRHSNDQSQK